MISEWKWDPIDACVIVSTLGGLDCCLHRTDMAALPASATRAWTAFLGFSPIVLFIYC